jgi:uncharacterized protein (TIGR02246 family)
VVKVPGTDVLHGVLAEWKAGIDAHDPRRVAAVFSADALFQGLRPYSVGPDGVFAYYDGQPLGMTVDYRILEARPIGEDSVLGYLAAEFSFADRTPIDLNLGVLVVRTADGWRIAYYQASPAAI